MKSTPRHAQEPPVLNIGNGVVLESREYLDLQKSSVGDKAERYFPELEKTGIFMVERQPEKFKTWLFWLWKQGNTCFFVPITPEIHKQNPTLKVFRFLGFEEEPHTEEPTKKIIKKNKAKLPLIIGWSVLAASIFLGNLPWVKKWATNDTPKNEPSILQHHSLSNPIPGVMLFDTIQVTNGQSLEQFSWEHLISMKYLYELNPHLAQCSVDGILNTDMPLIVPKAQDIFRLEKPQSWNDIAAKYSLDPLILMGVNGANIGVWDIVIIPTESQAQDIAKYLLGEDIETVLYELAVKPAPLEQIALFTEIPPHLHELFYEMNLASPDDKSPGAIHSKDQVLQVGAKFAVPTVRNYSREILAQFEQKHPTYDIHRVLQNDTVASIMKYYGISAEVFQKLNPNIPLNSTLMPGTEIKTRDTTNKIGQVCSQVILPPSVIAFVAEREMWTKKEGYLRPGIEQTFTTEVKKTVKIKGKKKTVTEKVVKYKFPNDGISIEPGMDLGQVEENILRYALDTIVAPAMIERIVLLSKTAQAFRKTKDSEWKIPTHAMKKIPEEFSDLTDFKLSEKETHDFKLRIMQAYWDIYLKKHVPKIDEPDFATDEMRAALMSIIYHRGGYFFKKEILELMNQWAWSDPRVLEAIKNGKKGTENRTVLEVETFESGLKKLSALEN